MTRSFFALIFLVFSQFLPEIFPFSSDIFVVIYVIITITYSGLKVKKWFLWPLLIITTFIFLKITLSGGLFTKFFISDLRPFILLLLVQLSINSFSGIQVYQRVKWMFIIILILSFPNFLGLISKGYYVSFISNFYSYRIGGGDYNIAQLAALNGRYSSFFAQPASAAIVFFTALIVQIKMLFDTESKDFRVKILLLVCLFLTFIDGLLAKSSFFQIGIFIALFLFLWGYNRISRLFFLTALSILAFFVFTFFNQFTSVDQFISFFHFATSGRYLTEGNIVPLFATIESFEYLIGLIDVPKYSKGIGDSSIWMKFAQGGFIYLTFYYVFLISINLRILLKYWNLPRLLFNTYMIILLLGESGFTAFSQPKASLLCLFFLMLSQDPFADNELA